MKYLAMTIVGVIVACLGLLWFLQGADIVHLEALLCLSNCETIVGGSFFWSVTGGIVFSIGVALVYFGLHRRKMIK